MPYAPIDPSTETGVLTIDGVVMHGPAWTWPDLTDLWFKGDMSGTDEHMPGADGDRAFARYGVATSYALLGVIDGDADRFGTRYSDIFAGLQTNIDYLNANVVGRGAAANGTRPATLLMPTGALRTADIHVTRLRIGTKARGINLRTGNPGIFASVTLAITIPRGHFS